MQGPTDLAHLDDGPYEVGGEKEQDPRLIPVPANSYLGRDPTRPGAGLTRCSPLLSSLSTSHPPVCVLHPVSVFPSLMLITLVSFSLSCFFSTSSSTFLLFCLAISLLCGPSSGCPFPGVSPLPLQGCSL